MDEKKRFLASVGDHRSRRLMALSEQLADLEADRNELGEAIAAGEAALDSLHDVERDLRSAKGWGTVDMLGGGMLSTMAKHSKMDAAQKKALEAQALLRRFREALTDVARQLELSLEVGGFLGFSDYFLDGLIADWLVQKKIVKAAEACTDGIAEVESILEGCRTRLADTEQSLEETRAARSAFIEEA